jgi:probable F420-dependent oxidoreductase
MLLGFGAHILYFRGLDPAAYEAVAVKADELNYESMWIGHHLVFRDQISQTYPYDRSGHELHTSSGDAPHRPDMHRMDPWVTIAYLAGRTKRLRFGTSVYILPLVDPFVTARAVTTADLLSRGRIIFGFGVGWNEEEFDDVGQSFGNRGRRTDEIVEILKALWTQPTIEHRGQFYSFGPVQFEPKPHQKPHPPMIYGGLSPAALRRASKLDGIVFPTNDLEIIRTALGTIGRLRAQAGIDGAYDVTASAPDPPTPDAIRRFEDAGVTRVTANMSRSTIWSTEAPEDTLELFLENLERTAYELSDVVAPT